MDRSSRFLNPVGYFVYAHRYGPFLLAMGDGESFVNCSRCEQDVSRYVEIAKGSTIMDIERILLGVTCVTSTLTLLCVTIAILPRMKEGMVVVRDATLWIVFGLIVVCLGWGVWQNVKNPSGQTASDWLLLPTAAASASPAPTVQATSESPTPVTTREPSGDPYFQRSATSR